MPDLPESLTWLPVDLCARAIVEASTATRSRPRLTDGVLHLVNTHVTTTWRDWLNALKRAGLKFEIESSAVWLEKLAASEEDVDINPSRKLLELWQRNVRRCARDALLSLQYGPDAESRQEPTIETQHASQFCSAITELRPLDAAVLDRLARRLV